MEIVVRRPAAQQAACPADLTAPQPGSVSVRSVDGIYDRLGLLRPAQVDAATGYPWYASSRLIRAHTVGLLHRLEMPLALIADVLEQSPHDHWVVGHPIQMATVSARIRVSPDEVWAVLADGWTYSNWVVGTSHMRAVEARWPQEGAVLHHAVGVWPGLVRDQTMVEQAQPPSLLVLRASSGPLGDARIELRLSYAGVETNLEMSETPVGGPGRWIPSPLSEAILRRRNTETLARLTAICERRTKPAD